MTQHQGHQVPVAYPGMAGPHLAQPIEVLDPRLLDHQKLRPRVHRPRDESDSDFDSISSFGSRSVEDGSYGYIERSRSRGRKHSSHRPSRSQIRSRSRSRGRISKPYKEKRSHGRTWSDSDSPLRDRVNAAHVNTSPHSPKGVLPSHNIFNIRIDNDNERANANAKKSRDAHNRTRDPRRSQSISPTGLPNIPYGKQDKYAAEPMFRGGSNNGSDSDSSFAGSSSIYSTTDGSVFSEPERMHMKSAQVPIRSHIPRPRDDGFTQPPYHDYDRRGKASYAQANDYPPQPSRARSPFYDDHITQPTSPIWQHPPQPVRRQSNPFNPRSRYPGQRSIPYAEPESRYGPVQPTQRYITEREHDPMELQDLADAMDYMKLRRQAKAGRRGSLRVPPGSLGMAADTDAWANPAYSGFRHV